MGTRALWRLPRSLYWLIRHVCWALGNEKSFFGWLRAVAIGAFPPLLWTFCFKQAARIPDSWRPAIHTWLLPPADDFLMSWIGLAALTLCVSPIAWYLWHSAHGALFPSLFTAKWDHTGCASGGGGSQDLASYSRVSEQDIELGRPSSLSVPSTPRSYAAHSTLKSEPKTLSPPQVSIGRDQPPSLPPHYVSSNQSRSRSPSMSSSSTLVSDHGAEHREVRLPHPSHVSRPSFGSVEEEEEAEAGDHLRASEDEAMMVMIMSRGRRQGWRKVYAVCVMTYPVMLYLMHKLAFSGIEDYKDLMAWTTYGALHFASPIVCAWWLWFFAPAGVARTFGWCLGCQNILGVMTHLSFPNAAPWFYDVYGSSLHPDPPPDYTYPGNPAGLVRVDKLLGTRLYASGFKKSPVVFGAFPSLHAATAVICALFVARYSRRKGFWFMLVYTYWMFWSTMYFHHHYVVDLIGGTIFASISFILALAWVIPVIEYQHEVEYRTIGWDRTFLGRGCFGTRLGQSWGSGHWIG